MEWAFDWGMKYGTTILLKVLYSLYGKYYQKIRHLQWKSCNKIGRLKNHLRHPVSYSPGPLTKDRSGIYVSAILFFLVF